MNSCKESNDLSAGRYDFASAFSIAGSCHLTRFKIFKLCFRTDQNQERARLRFFLLPVASPSTTDALVHQDVDPELPQNVVDDEDESAKLVPDAADREAGMSTRVRTAFVHLVANIPTARMRANICFGSN